MQKQYEILQRLFSATYWETTQAPMHPVPSVLPETVREYLHMNIL